MKLAKTEDGLTVIELDPAKKVIFIIEDSSGVFNNGEPINIEDGTIIFKNKECKMTFVEFEDNIEVKI